MKPIAPPKPVMPPMSIQPQSVNPEIYPIDLWNKVGTPVFPLGVLPEVIERYSRTMGLCMGADPCGIAMAALTVVAAAIPDRIKLRVKKNNTGWMESARLWTMLIGAPSSKKSPIISTVIRPLAKMDSTLVKDWQQRHKAWSSLSKKQRSATPEPLQRRMRIEDTTVEAAQEVLKGSSDGILCAQDELSGWFGMMEKYGSSRGASADRAFWLRAYNGGEFALNRVGRGVSLIDNLSISLLGGVQPEPIYKIAAEGVDDGLLQRMLPISIRSVGVGLDNIAPDIQDTYDFIVGMLPHVKLQNEALVFTPDAQILRRYIEEKHFELMSAELVSRKFASHVGKFDGLLARLCIIWHVLENDFVAPLPGQISYETVERVSKFMDDFLIPHVACFYSSLGYGDSFDSVQAVASHILARRLDGVTVRDVQRGTRAMRKLKTSEVLPVLQHLVAFNWLSEEAGPRSTSDPSFIVNPLVHSLYEEKGREEKERREKARKAMQKCFAKK